MKHFLTAFLPEQDLEFVHLKLILSASCQFIDTSESVVNKLLIKVFMRGIRTMHNADLTPLVHSSALSQSSKA